ncbi:Uncharacterized membrane protein F35D11.3 [Linum perenne]
METSTPSILPPTQRYAAGALFALSLHQAQIHQIRPWGLFVEEVHDDIDGASLSSNGNSSVSDDPDLWVHEKSGLLRLVFRFLEIDPSAWYGLEETAGSTGARCHIGAFLRLLTEDSDAPSPNTDKEIALSNAIDVTEDTMETNRVSYRSKKKKHREYENECREKLSSESDSRQPGSETPDVPFMTPNETAPTSPNFNSPRSPDKDSSITVDDKPIEVVMMISYHRKVTVLYELLSACLADIRNDSKSSTRRRKGYDARHRVALRLLSTWFDISWIKMEAAETMVACSAMAILKQQESKGETQSSETKWARIRRGSIIGAAAITGGALMAITGGLAAPAIAAGFGALAPTLGTLIRTVAGSVAVAASFGVIKPAAGAGLAGTKMARRTGSVEEFEFKPMGDSHNQGRLAVGIMISGFIFDEEDFFKPWEGLTDNLERYALQWESKNLIAISTAIRDWLTSTIASQLMRQGAMLTVMGALMAALYLPTTILAATSFIDSTWTIAIDRPVTLVGYSLGARVIFKCLQTLAETERNAEVVERVVLLGAPVAIKNENWGAARKMVAGRFVNAYSTNDWMLGVAFRANLLTQGLAGIQPIEVPGIENVSLIPSHLLIFDLLYWLRLESATWKINLIHLFFGAKTKLILQVDVTEYIEGHSSYLWAAGDILERLELDTYFPVFKNTPFSPSRRPGASKEEAA